MISYRRSDSIHSSREFNNLDSETQHSMRAETKPCYERMSVSLPLLSFNIPTEENIFACIGMFDSKIWDSPISS